jgi:cytochrome P450
MQNPPQQLSAMTGPKKLPLLGNALSIRPTSLHKTVERWCQEFGDFFVFYVFGKPVVVVADPESIRVILKDRPENFGRYTSVRPVLEEMGVTGVFSAEGETWKKHRMLWINAMNAHKVEAFHSDLATITDRLLSRFNHLCEKNSVVDIREEFTRFAVDVTVRFAFGQDVNTIENGTCDIQDHLDKILPAMNRRLNAPFPYWQYFKLPADRTLDKDLALLKSTVTTFIQKAREQRKLSSDAPDSLLEALVDMQAEDGSDITDEDIYGSTLLTLVAGEDTTASTMGWMAYFLAFNPEVQAKYAEKVSAQASGETQQLEIADKAVAEVLNQLVYETLRLKPVAPLIFLSALSDVEIGGYKIPSGTDLLLATRHAMNREYKNHLEYEPERWKPEDLKKALTMMPVPFGGGPRMCPGRNIAMSELRSVALMLLRNFHIVPVGESKDVEEILAFAMCSNNLSVRLNKK